LLWCRPLTEAMAKEMRGGGEHPSSAVKGPSGSFTPWESKDKLDCYVKPILS
jgi:hypothetical protein